MPDCHAAICGNAVVYCEAAFDTPNGKTAHGLVRTGKRFRVVAVIDSTHAGRDAGTVLDGRPRGIPICSTLRESIDAAAEPVAWFVIGLAPEGGRLGPQVREAVIEAIESRLGVCAGLHDFLSEDPEIAALAADRGVTLYDVRKPPPRSQLHFWSGKIAAVKAPRVAVLGTDSAVGKRTTALVLLEALRQAGRRAELVGTGQTAWMQGVTYGIILDTLVNDFVAGEIEHAVWTAWDEARPDVILVEGQGSLLNPAYPGGFEILAAARPAAVVLQHAPARKEYDGFPGYPMHPLERQIEAIELIGGKPVVAVTVNSEGLDAAGTASACAAITRSTGLVACDVLRDGPERIVAALQPYLTGAAP